MKPPQIAQIRLLSQHIGGNTLTTPQAVVSHMCAMQAQDFAMAKWAVGIRLQKGLQTAVEAAFDTGKILRTHLLRPTWHFVTPADIYWMLELTAPRIKNSMRSHQKQMELTEKTFAQTNKIIEKLLSDGTHAARQTIAAALTKAKIKTNENRLAHILMRAELDAVICSGKPSGKNQTYALLAYRAEVTKPIPHEEALAKLATRYFTSHCPATLADFTWWSGLNAKDAKQALELVKDNFIQEKIDDQTFWLPADFTLPRFKKLAFLLPGFDEYTISYKNRSASLPLQHHKKSISINGIFWPVIAIDGQIVGNWNVLPAKKTL